jgi:hypothetical protein
VRVLVARGSQSGLTKSVDPSTTTEALVAQEMVKPKPLFWMARLILSHARTPTQTRSSQPVGFFAYPPKENGHQLFMLVAARCFPRLG